MYGLNCANGGVPEQSKSTDKWLSEGSVGGSKTTKDNIGTMTFGKDRAEVTVVTLCGSTRFKEEYREAEESEGFKGNAVLTCAFFAHADQRSLSIEDKRRLDVLHLRKIDLSDEILVLNIGGYIGDSTALEIAYARSTGKRVRFWELES